ncbi:MAG: hypothetical protein KA152_15840 [Verrucomicrobiales bacterium]|nr:hypothetical protein [Verrucomicrobiales bacterium]
MKLGGLKPSPIAIAGMIGLLWTISQRAVRDFIWADLRDGLIDLRTLPEHPRRLARAGFILFGMIIAALLLSDFWRGNSKLLDLTGVHIFRGQLLPVVLLPATLFLLVVGWSFILTGALHCHPVLRLGFLTIYLLIATSWVNSLTNSGAQTEQSIAAASVAGVAIVFVLRWRAQPRPVLEFSIIFTLLSIVFLLAQRQELKTLEYFGIPTGLARISVNINFLGGLVTPLLLLVGMRIADFTRRASHWAGDILTARATRRTSILILTGLLVWRLFFVAAELSEQASTVPLQEYLLGLLGGLGEIAVVAVAWWLTGRFHPIAPDEETMAGEVEPWARPLVLTSSAIQLVTFFLLALLMAVSKGAWFEPARKTLFMLVDLLTNHVAVPWHFLFSASMIILSIRLSQKGRRGLALYLGILGALYLWWGATSRGQWLEAFNPSNKQSVEVWWVILFATATIVWAARRTLTSERITRLVIMLLILTLMRQRDFIENPFSPIFGFAGIAFIAFSLIWDIATSGSWTNAGSPGLPRISRVFLYLGSILLTATLVNWAVTLHDHETIEKFTGGTALVGFDRFGKPLLYSAFAIALAMPRSCRRSQSE